MIAKATGQNKLLTKDGDTVDIIKAILETNALPIERQTVKLSQKVPQSYEGLRQLWYFVKGNIQYMEDPLGVQWVKEPARLWRDNEGDCKSFTLLMCSVFKNWGVPYTIRFVAFSAKSDFTHVYPIVYLDGKAVIMDAVWRGFDREKRFSKKIDYNFGDMTKVYRLSGTSGVGTAAAQAPDAKLLAVEAYYKRVNDNLPKNTGADITEMTEAEAIQYLTGGAAVTGIGSTAPAFVLPTVILPEGVNGIAGNIFTKIGDALKTAVKNVINAIFKGPLKTIGPVFLFLFHDKVGSAIVESKKLKQSKFVNWISNVCGTTNAVVLATMADGIKTKFGGKSPQEVIALAQKGQIQGIGVIQFAALLPVILDIINKILSVFKKDKKEVPPVTDAASDLSELKETPPVTVPEAAKNGGVVIPVIEKTPPSVDTSDGATTTTTTAAKDNTMIMVLGGAAALYLLSTKN